MRTKAGIKKVRSFQRTICRIITCAFKTAPTESLILLSNLLPLDLRILEIAAMRLLSRPTELCFSNSSRNFILQRLPFVSKEQLLTRVSLPLLTNYPPWNILLYTSHQLSSVVPLHPCVVSTLHCFIRVYQKCGAAGFCVVFTGSSAVLEIFNLSLPPSISFRTGMSLAFLAALEKVCGYRQFFSACEIFVTEKLVFLQPATALSHTEACNLALLNSLGSFCHVFNATSSNSPGLRLARFWAQSPSPFLTSTAPSSHSHVKQTIRSKVWSIWNEEWSCLQTNLSAKAFFPSVSSAKALLRLRTNSATTQIITGHCFLNSHQHRFFSSPSASCHCGAPVETIQHFILHCPTFATLRSNLVDAVNSCGHTWPPPFNIFPQIDLLWNALVVFVLRTKRLSRKKCERSAQFLPSYI